MKYKRYTLYAKIYGSDSSKYTIEESVRNDKKRQQALMYGELIEQLDTLTSKYDSVEDLLDSYPEEVFGVNVVLYEPVIIVDKHETDRSKSYEIYDIVFKDDAQELSNKQNIINWTLEYLKHNHHNINHFRGIKDIFTKIGENNPNIGILRKIELTVKIYFKDDSYKKYREAYFTLKHLDPKRVRQNGIHR